VERTADVIERWYPTSVTRLVPLEGLPHTTRRLPRSQWATGDVVLGIVTPEAPRPALVESPSGRMVGVGPGDAVVGALGTRAATLEAVGDWRDVGDDLRFQGLTSAGVFGRCTSRAITLQPLVTYEYGGHVILGAEPVRMADFVPPAPADAGPFTLPTILLIGTSMDAGKTVAARAIIRRLKRRRMGVAGAKLSGVGRYRDILRMQDAGADAIFDFVDAGLPSTICPQPEFARALRPLLARIGASGADVLVAEAGASPLEPYNGETVLRELEPSLRLVVLCASDPYAVVGVMEAFGLKPDVVSGRATSTEAGIALVERLAGIPALNMLDPDAEARLDALLEERLAPSAAATADV
jgi:hypothetical protein